ncbi:MAG: RNA methyltransferase [Bacteroidales bacterium]|nr:RNA methyltransferase [Bacteroidales bacterium]
MQETLITSLQNPLVKQVVKLQQKAGERNQKKQFVAEGAREVSLALQRGIEPEYLFICPDIFSPEKFYPINTEPFKQTVRYVSAEVYNKMAYRQNAEGILMVAHQYQLPLTKIKLSANPLIIVLESVEKPGNLGAVLRTADAVNADAVIVCDHQTDIFNPNVIRSSLGCVFTRQIALCNSDKFIEWASQKCIKTLVASVQAEESYYEKDMTKGVAIILGTEAQGLSEIWYKHADEKVRIPMQGKIDSLNVSVSAAVLVFEAQRQRLSGK